MRNFKPWPKSKLGKVLAFFSTCLPGVVSLLAMLVVKLIDGNTNIMARDGAFDVVASGRFGMWMWIRGWSGFSLGWVTFYWTKKSWRPLTACHERWHLYQLIKRSLYFYVWYLYHLIKVGYKNNPAEKEARKMSRKIIASNKLYINDYY